MSVMKAWLLAADESGPLPGKPRVLPETDENGQRRKKVVRLAEDNPADVLLVREAMEHYGLSVELHVVDDGEKALDFIQRVEDNPQAPCPDMLLLDLNLPRRSGKEVLKRVRQSPKCKHIPVLIITSSDLATEREELARLGATQYFRKPSSFDAFLKVGEIVKELLQDDTIN